MSMTRKEAQFGQPNDNSPGASSNPPLLPPVIGDEEAEVPVPLEQLRPAVAVHYPGDGPVSLIHYRSEPNYPNSFERMPNSDIADFDSKVAYEDIGDMHSKRKMFQEQSAPPPKSSTCPLVVLFLMVIITFLMAAGAIGIAVYALTSQNESSTVSDLRQQVMELSAKVDNLETELLTGRVEQLEADLAAVSDTISHSVDPPSPGNSSEPTVTISRDLLLYENCTTTLLEICPVEQTLITAIPSFQRCTTENYPLHVEDEYTMNVNCGILNARDEENPATAAVRIDEDSNQFSCTCYVTVNNDLIPRGSIVDCGLFVTRCPKVYTFEL